MPALSVYIITLNEEKRLPQTLAAASEVADEIVVVDSGSTDKTEEIAKSFGAKFIFNKWKNISSQKNFAENQCSNDWVLSLDADEVLSPGLIEEIKKIKTAPAALAYKVKIGNMYPGYAKPRPFTRRYNLVRLYNRKTGGNMPDDLTHDRVVLRSGVKPAQLRHEIYHYSYLDLFHLWNKLNVYTNELVKTAVVTNKKYSRLRLLTEFPRQFLTYYIGRRNCFDGWWGFINSTTMAYFRFLKIAKYFEYKMLEAEAKKNKK